MSMHQDSHQGSQCIHCSVHSCKHNHQARQLCKLSAINVCPVSGKASANTDESMCGSYEH